MHEHELYSFNIERENLKWVYRANLDFINELEKENAIDTLANHSNLKGYVFKRKLMNPKRVKGVGAFVSLAYIY